MTDPDALAIRICIDGRFPHRLNGAMLRVEYIVIQKMYEAGIELPSGFDALEHLVNELIKSEDFDPALDRAKCLQADFYLHSEVIRSFLLAAHCADAVVYLCKSQIKFEWIYYSGERLSGVMNRLRGLNYRHEEGKVMFANLLLDAIKVIP